jgi:DUF4097 and DUF4098 domain-containing protein YvlB
MKNQNRNNKKRRKTMKTWKQLKQTTFLFALVLCFLFLYGNAQAAEVNKTFKAKETVEIRTVSGDCVVKKGESSEINVRVVYDYSPDCFEPILMEQGNTLVLKEKFHSTAEMKSCSGKSQWTVIVPEKTDIDFSSASGELKLDGLTGTMKAKVASGDITVNHFKGKVKIKSASGEINMTGFKGHLKIKTASGDIKLMHVTGGFEVSTASGDVEARDVEFTEPSELASVSGDVNIELTKSPTVDLDLKVVSGDVTLDYKGNPVKGYFVFKGMVKKFSCPFPFDDGEEERYNPFGTKYLKKGDSPTITLKAVSGKLSLKK